MCEWCMTYCRNTTNMYVLAPMSAQAFIPQEITSVVLVNYQTSFPVWSHHEGSQQETRGTQSCLYNRMSRESARNVYSSLVPGYVDVTNVCELVMMPGTRTQEPNPNLCTYSLKAHDLEQCKPILFLFQNLRKSYQPALSDIYSRSHMYSVMNTKTITICLLFVIIYKLSDNELGRS